MQIDKQQIIGMLRARGEDDKADRAEQELPEQVDQDEHGGLLEQLGLEPQELLSKLSSRF